MENLEQQVIELKKDVKSLNNENAKLYRLLNRHIGLVGDEQHGYANDSIGGFMPPELFKGSRQRFRARTWIKDVDVLTLDNGYYTGLNFINAPVKNTTWYCDVNVYSGTDGRRNITFIENSANRIYHTTISSDKTGNKYRWNKVSQSCEVFKAKVTDTHSEGMTLELSGKISDFTQLEFTIYDKELHKPFFFKTNRSYGGKTEWNINNTEPNLFNASEIDIEIFMNHDTTKPDTIRIQSNKSVTIKDFSITETSINKLVVEKVTAIF